MNDKMHKNCDQYRHLKGEDIQSLNLKNLMAVEHAVEHGLDKVRDHQACIHSYACTLIYIKIYKSKSTINS